MVYRANDDGRNAGNDGVRRYVFKHQSSPTDLAALTEFYGSPVGQRALVAMPKLQARLIPIGMRVGMEAGRAAMETTMKRQVGDGAKPPRT